MTHILYYQAQASARELTERLRAVLSTIWSPSTDALLRELDSEPHRRPMLVLTGQYSSGKSTLIRALTDGAAEVVVDADIATDSIEEFDWDDNVTLVDTPGVQAKADHDELADRALRGADLVLFTVTVELFDDGLINHLDTVLSEYGKARQTLIVMTKSGTRKADFDVRAAAVQDALGAYAGQVPWVLCDAQRYLDGLDCLASDPDRAARRIEASNLNEVRALIDEVARSHGDLARYSQPLQRVDLLAGEAAALLADDPVEQITLTVLNRQRAALVQRRGRIDNELEGCEAEFRADALRAASRFADFFDQYAPGVQAPQAEVDNASQRLNGDLNMASQTFQDRLSRKLEQHFDDLTTEVQEISASPQARALPKLLRPEVSAGQADASSAAPSTAGTPITRPAWAPKVAELLTTFQKNWGAGSGGIKAAAGSNGHKVVYDIGKKLGKSWKPWEAVKMANAIGKVAKIAGPALAVGMEVYSVVAEERAISAEQRARQAGRRQLISEVERQSSEIAGGLLRGVRADLNDSFAPALNELDTAIETIQGTRTARSERAATLVQIQKEARQALMPLIGLAGQP